MGMGAEGFPFWPLKKHRYFGDAFTVCTYPDNHHTALSPPTQHYYTKCTDASLRLATPPEAEDGRARDKAKSPSYCPQIEQRKRYSAPSQHLLSLAGAIAVQVVREKVSLTISLSLTLISDLVKEKIKFHDIAVWYQI
ncbi:hypothetical protein LWI28_014641 [Acer negundo]|uniref:Uncharacterized protein n=1 Tax=Acer negundo TaxID=4023 RepID=A0AAD5JGI0_ACENE|nr:hypothetical protein LWI28_014641 [Acer negundo]